jgi:hypothetical protein
VVGDHHHLLLVGQVDADDRVLHRHQLAQPGQSSVAVPIPAGHTITVVHERPPNAMGHQARQAHQGDVPTPGIDTQNVFPCRDQRASDWCVLPPGHRPLEQTTSLACPDRLLRMIETIVRAPSDDGVAAAAQLLHHFNVEYDEPTPPPDEIAVRLEELIEGNHITVLLAREQESGAAVGVAVMRLGSRSRCNTSLVDRG